MRWKFIHRLQNYLLKEENWSPAAGTPVAAAVLTFISRFAMESSVL
jgi:hypothetical protein